MSSGLYIDPSTGVANLNMAPFRNKMINGDMRIDQRNAGVSTGNLTTSAYTVDRWKLTIAGGGSIAAQQVATVPNATFTHSLQLTVGSADTSLASADKYDLRQTIEGNNVYDLAFGSSAAATVTVSFWARASIAGTYALALQNGAGDRSYVTTYTLAAANTWQYVSITVAGDTTGTWAKDNTAGLAVVWALSQNGSASQAATLNAWQATAALSTATAVNWIGTAGATFLITGVQLERGTLASAFETRSYGVELGLCQRYYQTVGGSSGVVLTTTSIQVHFNFMVAMRTSTPSITIGSGSVYQYGAGSTSVTTGTITTVLSSRTQTILVNFPILNVGYTAGAIASCQAGVLYFDTEL